MNGGQRNFKKYFLSVDGLLQTDEPIIIQTDEPSVDSFCNLSVIVSNVVKKKIKPIFF